MSVGTIARVTIVISGLLLGLALPGCTKSPPATDAASARPSLGFDYLEATEFLFSKLDPAIGDWSTRIVRETRGSDRGGTDSEWRIELAPNGRHLQDRRANGAFILHLLDTARTIQLKEAGLSGPLESFGLAHPFYSLHWKIGSGADAKTYRLDLGSPAKTPDGSAVGMYGRFVSPAESPVYVITGALLEMLGMIRDFSTFRLPTLATFTSDDVDEIQAYSGKKRVFYAQRDGDRWTDSGHRPVRTDMQAFLDQLTHQRIIRFIDDPAEAKAVSARLDREVPSPALIDELKLSGRNRTPVVIRLGAGSGKTYASISTRTDDSADARPAVFEMYPQLLTLVSGIRRP